MHVSDLVDSADLEQAIADGLIRVQTSPHGALALRIYNYTEKATYSKTWTDATTTCRGLIVAPDGTVVARPWPKFFNYGEHPDGSLDPAARVEVTDKADGSLGVLHMSPAGLPTIATRGSFTSEQAVHATQLYRDRYAGMWLPGDGFTYLFEIVFPGNRIVLDYGDLDDLILLGGVDVATGRAFGPHAPECAGWPGPRVDMFPHETLAEALAAEPRPNAEGLVVRFVDTGLTVKIKQADYVHLHRLFTGLTARRLWERAAVHAVAASSPEMTARMIGQRIRLDVAEVQAILDAGPNWVEELTEAVPEEFREWIETNLQRFVEQVDEIVAIVEGEAFGWGDCDDRATIARGIADHPYRGIVFACLDGKPWLAQAWAEVRPDAERPFASRSEDVA